MPARRGRYRYKKRRYGRKGYKKRRSRRGRRKGRRSKHFRVQKVNNIVRYSANATFSVAPLANYMWRVQCTLGQALGVAELTPVFRYYKISHAVVELTIPGSRLNEGPVNTTGTVNPDTGVTSLVSLGAGGPVKIHTVVPESWYQGPTTINEMREYGNYKWKYGKWGENRIYNPILKWITEIAEGSTTTAEVDKRSGWAPTTQPNIVHYGKTIGVENKGDTPLTFSWRYILYMKFRGMK